MSPIEGELFAVKGSVDQVDDRALDTQRQIVAGILLIYMTVWFSHDSIRTTVPVSIIVPWIHHVGWRQFKHPLRNFLKLKLLQTIIIV